MAIVILIVVGLALLALVARAGVLLRGVRDGWIAGDRTGRGQYPPAQAEPRVSQVNLVGAGLACLGATLGIVSIFLPLMQNPGFPLGIQDNSLIQGDGFGTGIAVRYVLCAVVILSLTYRYWRVGMGSWGILIPAVVLGAGAIIDMNSEELTTLYSYDPVTGSLNAAGGSVNAKPAIALYVAAVGGALAAIGGWIMWRSAPVAAGLNTDNGPSELGEAERIDVAARSGGDFADRLRQLDDLRRDGILTEDEFATKKAQLLASDQQAITPPS